MKAQLNEDKAQSFRDLFNPVFDPEYYTYENAHSFEVAAVSDPYDFRGYGTSYANKIWIGDAKYDTGSKCLYLIESDSRRTALKLAEFLQLVKSLNVSNDSLVFIGGNRSYPCEKSLYYASEDCYAFVFHDISRKSSNGNSRKADFLRKSVDAHKADFFGDGL